MSRLGAAALVTLAVAAVLQVGRSGASNTRVTATCGTSVLGLNSGQVTNLVHGTVTANSTFVGGAGFVLRQRHFLCTDITGQVIYRLTRFKTTTCNTRPRSKLQLYPSGLPSRIIQFLPSLGKSWCSTSKGKEGWFGTNVGQITRLLTNDPVFGVTVSRRSSEIQQTYGFFAVYPPQAKQPFILGPQEQVSVSSTGVVSGPSPLVLSPEDRAAIAELGAAVPRPNYTRPAAGSSKVLARMYSRGEIRVGLSPRATPQVAAFTKRYFTLLARRWKLRPAIVSDDAAASLAEGTVDVIVTQTRAPGGIDVRTLPFTQQGRTNWDLELLPESALTNGFSRYHRTSLEAGDYAAHYRAAFAAAPSYERFRTFIFPSLPSAPGG